jgi:hypothetical protein
MMPVPYSRLPLLKNRKIFRTVSLPALATTERKLEVRIQPMKPGVDKMCLFTIMDNLPHDLIPV